MRLTPGQKTFIRSWLLLVGILCAPTLTVCFFTLPRIPACIGASRAFYGGVRDCETEIERRRSEMREHAWTGRILLRTFVVCANLAPLKTRADEACSWLHQPDR